MRFFDLLGQTVDHIDRNKTNNDISNLRWASRTEQNLNRTQPHKYKKEPIWQCDKKTLKIIQKFDSTSAASEATGISYQSINGVLCHPEKNHSAGGYFWTRDPNSCSEDLILEWKKQRIKRKRERETHD